MKIENLKIGEEYKAVWEDTFSYVGWWGDDDLKKKSKEMSYYINTVGFFAGYYNGFVILCTSRNEQEGFFKWGAPKWIPAGCIKTIKKIK